MWLKLPFSPSLLILFTILCGSSLINPGITAPELFLEFPESGEWTDQGVVLSPGPDKWDSFTPDGFGAHAMVKKNGVFYLYYNGSSGPRETDGGPANRAIGLATSTDGIHFSKYDNNPIVTFQSPNGIVNQEEEGAFHPAVSLDPDGNFIMYWSAIVATGSTSVKAELHVSSSQDGKNFKDHGTVLAFKNGSRNEIWPLGILYFPSAQGNWHLWSQSDFFSGRKIVLTHSDRYDSVLEHPTKFLKFDSKKTIFTSPYLHPSGDLLFLTTEKFGSGLYNIYLRTSSILNMDQLSERSEFMPNNGTDNIVAPIIIRDEDYKLWRFYYTLMEPRSIRLKTSPIKNFNVK